MCFIPSQWDKFNNLFKKHLVKLHNSLRAVDAVYDSTWKIIKQNTDTNKKNREKYRLGKGGVTGRWEPCLHHLKVCVAPWLPMQINY